MKYLLQPDPNDREKALAHLEDYFEATSGHYSGFQVRCVLVAEEPGLEPTLGICMVRGCPGEKPAQEESLKYDRFLFLDGWLDTQDFLPFLRGTIENSVLKIENRSVDFQRSPAFRAQPLLPSLNDVSDFPGACFYTDSLSDKSFPHTFDTEPLIDFWNPVYSSVVVAFAKWIDYRGPLSHSHSWLGSVVIFLPECRAHFGDVTLREGQLSVGITGEADTHLRIKGFSKFQDEATPIEGDVGGEDFSIPLPDATDEISLYLIDSEGWIYDRHFENPYGSSGRRRILKTQEVHPELLSRIQQGEGEELEFKEWVETDRGKINEVLATVSAFANSKGGEILIGVDKHAQIVGLEQNLYKKYKGREGVGERVERYQTDLRTAINDALAPTPRFRTKPIRLTNRTIVSIHVEESLKKPISRLDSNKIYVRKGASSRMASCEELKKLLCRQQQ